jgi:hypothetical protein
MAKGLPYSPFQAVKTGPGLSLQLPEGWWIPPVGDGVFVVVMQHDEAVKIQADVVQTIEGVIRAVRRNFA